MSNLQEIYFAGGCFWGVGEYFSRIKGVSGVTVGYANGVTSNPTYKDVCEGETKYAETAHITYDPAIVTLQTLTRQFFKIIDPTSLNRQGNDVGTQYRTGIYYTREDDKEVVFKVIQEEQKRFSKPIVVELLPLLNYYLAEEYHQDYLKKNPNGYCHITFESLKDLENPNKPTKEELRNRLSSEEYYVTQECGTERAFSGKYWNHHERGIYVDIVTNEPLFASCDKFDSGSGWPSFTKPILADAVTKLPDNSHNMQRVEVRSKSGDSHLGHVFEDGPEGKLRYCINSAALRFIPYDEMEKEGYGYLKALVC
ncbi:MAG: peptide-methionine (S)-S-oxide reductase MsrA [Campylobacteraceae bacterium]|jgi:peptide methionine sulfoxide reductase msrA/msrB|nr:peptide-methionine (S)-S-oxide reductase MsrA [Campylobacteraceae bacterium]